MNPLMKIVVQISAYAWSSTDQSQCVQEIWNRKQNLHTSLKNFLINILPEMVKKTVEYQCSVAEKYIAKMENKKQKQTVVYNRCNK